MTRRFVIATAAAVCSIYVGSGFSRTSTLSAQSRRPLTPDDIFEFKSVGDPRISPDGAWVAYTVTTMDRKEDNSDTDIYMVSTAGGDPIRLTSSKKPETGPRWSSDGRYLAFTSARDGKKSQVYLLDRRGGEAQAITDYKTGASSVAWSPDGSKLALLVSDPDPKDQDAEKPDADKKPKPHVITRLQFMRDGEGYLTDVKRHIHVFDIATKTDVEIAHDRYDDGAPVWSPDGKLIAFSANRTDNPDANDNSDIFVVDVAAALRQAQGGPEQSRGTGAKPRAVTTYQGSDGSPSFSPDSKSIVYTQGGDPKDIWYAMNNVALVPVDGGAPKILTPGLDRSVSRPQFVPDGTKVLFLLEEGGNVHLARVPAAGGTIERVLNGERDVNAYDVGKSGDVTFLEGQPQQPSEVFFIPAAPKGPVTAVPPQLTHVNDAFLAKIALGTVERYKAKSADGTMIDAYLTRPPNAPAGNNVKLPTILRIHGGPVSQYSTGFNQEWQMLAAQGFAVVAANPRGSSGYGRDFSRAIWADWGNKDYDDVIAAVDTAIAMGVADPDRLGVGGWSYGGILTDHVISKTTRFKAAISGASEFNYLANYGNDHYQRQWEAELGLPWQKPEVWMRISPFFRMDKIVTPTLVLGGDLDVNVPIIGGQQLYQGLKRLGRDTELVVYPGEYHGIRRPSFQKDRYERYITWYSKYLKPAATKTSPQ
jgi:dipeptidyl aminopeptidase/acylaminoacyl peptidase